MTAFARFLGEKAERYIELRRSLGYAFSKQAGTLRAFVHYVERAQLDRPATRTMALDFALSFSGAANSRATRHGVLRRFTSISPSMTSEPRPWSAELSPDPERFLLRVFSARLSWRRSSTHAPAFRQAPRSEGGRWRR
ncbi:hypothetical protein X766_34240 [Mesorhizobium sp. LSJC255A00]|uniref:hypothetical protein n=1 Tax=Mesorhizobium sp. LSJC255A00 TaxID=1287313 RepID=UPI0003CEB3A6|nr:hypothetical protein [Mesorhizobium sp. LSJC255A00]ESX08422.1 hypothetical protein X766_34240 [Mesorhizobium sp. LSJC255A00]